MKRIGLLVVATVLLAGCNAASRPGRGELLTDRTAIVAKHDTICKGYGAVPGTPAYVQCPRDAGRAA